MGFYTQNQTTLELLSKKMFQCFKRRRVSFVEIPVNQVCIENRSSAFSIAYILYKVIDPCFYVS